MSLLNNFIIMPMLRESADNVCYNLEAAYDKFLDLAAEKVDLAGMSENTEA